MKSVEQIILALLAATVLMPTITACPVAEDIAPCVCYNVSATSYNLDCQFIHSTDQLNAISSVDFPEKTFYQLSITESDLDEIDRLPRGVSFEHIYLQNNFYLSRVSEEALVDSYDTLTYFKADNTSLASIDFLVANLPSFTRFDHLRMHNHSVSFIDSLHSNSMTFFEVPLGNIKAIAPGESTNFPLL